MNVHIVVTDVGTTGIPSHVFLGSLEEVIDASATLFRYLWDGPLTCGNVPHDEPLGEEGEYVFYIFESRNGGWEKVGSADTIEGIYGWRVTS